MPKLPATPTIPNTRLRGFHLRNLKQNKNLSRETPAFTSKLYLDETAIGSAENDGGGGPVRLRIDGGYRARWSEFVAYVHSFPWDRQADGTPELTRDPDDATIYLLVKMAEADQEMKRSRAGKSMIIAHEWVPAPGGGIESERITLAARAPKIDVTALDPDLVRILVVGMDNPEIIRFTDPPAQPAG